MRSASARRPVVIVGVTVIATLIALLGWLALRPKPRVEPRPRAYRDVNACLLTDSRGVAAPDAAPVWAGMQEASTVTHGQVRFLAVSGDQTVANAQSFIGTLVLGRCAVIVAVGDVPVKAVVASAATFPSQKFVAVGGGPSSSVNVSYVSALSTEDLQAAITAAVKHYLATP